MNVKRAMKLGIAPLMLSLMMLLTAHQSQAAVSVVVTHTGPESVKVGESLNVSFSADLTGKPTAHRECEISDLSYTWTITVTGSDKGIVSYSKTGKSVPIGHIANNKCQSYSVSASCTVSYKMKECGDGDSGSAPGSDSATIAVREVPCESE